jgi:hypothetical protein
MTDFHGTQALSVKKVDNWVNFAAGMIINHGTHNN